MTNSSSRIAFLFPGQGSQAVGMGKELAANYPVARQTFEEADEALGYKLSELCFEGPEEKLKLTEITQPAILTASVAAWRVLQEKGVKPDVRRRAQPGRVLGARGRGHAHLCRCRADGSQSRQVYAGSSARGRGRDGGHSRDDARKGQRNCGTKPRREKSARRPTSIRPSKS